MFLPPLSPPPTTSIEFDGGGGSTTLSYDSHRQSKFKFDGAQDDIYTRKKKIKTQDGSDDDDDYGDDDSYLMKDERQMILQMIEKLIKIEKPTIDIAHENEESFIKARQRTHFKQFHHMLKNKKYSERKLLRIFKKFINTIQMSKLNVSTQIILASYEGTGITQELKDSLFAPTVDYPLGLMPHGSKKEELRWQFVVKMPIPISIQMVAARLENKQSDNSKKSNPILSPYNTNGELYKLLNQDFPVYMERVLARLQVSLENGGDAQTNRLLERGEHLEKLKEIKSFKRPITLLKVTGNVNRPCRTVQLDKTGGLVLLAANSKEVFEREGLYSCKDIFLRVFASGETHVIFWFGFCHLFSLVK